MEKKRKNCVIVLGGSLLAIWLMMVILITILVAQHFTDILSYQMEKQAGDILNWHDFKGYYEVEQNEETIFEREEKNPGFMEHTMRKMIDFADEFSVHSHFRTDHFGQNMNLLREKGLPVQSAVVFFDESENAILEGGDYEEEAVQYLEKEYQSLLDLLINRGADVSPGIVDSQQVDLGQVLIFDRNALYKKKVEDDKWETTKPDITVTIVFMAKPLELAVERLLHIYLITLCVVLIVWIYLWMIMRKRWGFGEIL